MPQSRYVNLSKDVRYVNNAPAARWVNNLEVATPDYPTAPKWRAATIGSFAPSYVSVTNSLRRQARTRGAHAWQISLQYSAMTRADFAPLWSFLVSRTISGAVFSVRLPDFSPRGTGAGTPQVNGGGQTGGALVTDGWGISQYVLRRGDFVQFEGQTKVHQVAADVLSDSSGNATVTLHPPVRSSPADNATILTTPLFVVALAGDTIEASFDQCLIVPDFEVVLVETN
jgi:hypothetical protein